MKGYVIFWWDSYGKATSSKIKEAIAHAPDLVYPDYNKDFIMYNYALEHMMFSILMQKNQEGIESPIDFIIFYFNSHELKYSQMENHAYTVVKEVKYFRFYILNSHTRLNSR